MHYRSDIKESLRTFLKNPGFALAAVAALALGIGANTAIFTVVDTVLLKPLSYPDADRIVQFSHRAQAGGDMLSTTLASIPMQTSGPQGSVLCGTVRKRQ